MDVWQHPTSPVTERYRRLSFSVRVGNSIQHSLIHRGIVSSSFVPLDKGRVKTLWLQEKGKRVLGISAGESDRHGGPEHRYWAKRIADHLRANGYKVEEEVPVGGGKTIDLVAARDGKRIAFEIETGKSDAAANAKKCLAVGFDHVVVVATSARSRHTLAAVLPRHQGVLCLSASEVARQV